MVYTRIRFTGDRGRSMAYVDVTNGGAPVRRGGVRGARVL